MHFNNVDSSSFIFAMEDQPKQPTKLGRPIIFTPEQDQILMNSMQDVAPGGRSQENADKCKELAATWGLAYSQVKARRLYLIRIKNQNSAVESGIVKEKVKRFVFSAAQDESIVSRIIFRKSYEQIANELGLKTIQVRMRWYRYLSKQYPDIKYDPEDKPINLPEFPSIDLESLKLPEDPFRGILWK